MLLRPRQLFAGLGMLLQLNRRSKNSSKLPPVTSIDTILERSSSFPASMDGRIRWLTFMPSSFQPITAAACSRSARPGPSVVISNANSWPSGMRITPSGPRVNPTSISSRCACRRSYGYCGMVPSKSR